MSRELRNLLWFLAGFSAVVLSGFASTARAADDDIIYLGGNRYGWAYVKNANGYTKMTAAQARLWTKYGADSAGLNLQRNVALKVGSEVGLKRAVELSAYGSLKVPLSAIAASARLLARASPYIAIASTIGSLYQDADISYEENQNTWVKVDDPLVRFLITDVGLTHSGIFQTYGSFPAVGTPYTGAAVLISALTVVAAPGQPCLGSDVWTEPYFVGNPEGDEVEVRSGCASPGSTSHSSRYAKIEALREEEIQYRPASDAEMDAAISASPGGSDLSSVFDTVVDNGRDIELPGNSLSSLTPSMSTHTSDPTTTKTTTIYNPDGSVTEREQQTSQTANFTEEGDQISNNYVVVNVTNNTTTLENEVVIEVVVEPEPPDQDGPLPDEEEDEEEEEEEEPFEDSSFPDIPDLYEQKYPEGLAGVWAVKWPQLQATTFIAGITGMFPTLGSGSCFSWSMNFDFGALGNFGTLAVPVECWVLQVAGLVLLTTACFTAWWILFG